MKEFENKIIQGDCIEEMKKLPDNSIDAVVTDPLGSGTTAIACINTNRRFILIEKEEEYCKIAKARIKPYLERRRLKFKQD